jgi:primosomal protein N' (replication factor Y)
VTGSGKTEIYLRCIDQVVKRGRQAIVLVPEIALTPQTVRRFTARFERVAILHSGLTAGQRHRYWQQISSGEAQVVVGARSAIFAPVKDLGIVVVDEEHEASYKQDQLPRYNARDVAIKRGQLEQVAVILGSATPSLEMYWRATRTNDPSQQRRFFLLKMPNRAASAAMPKVELVNMQYERKMRKGVHLISQRLEKLLRDTFNNNQQAILLLNRRGYSNFVHCPSCQHIVQCKYCDTTMTYHRSAETHVSSASHEKGLHTGQLHCHYCLAVSPLPTKCPECSKKLSLFGLGTQRVEEEFTRKFPGIEYARVDSDTMRSSKDYEAMLARFGKGEIKAMLGTQMIAKGLDYPNVTLVGVISGDTSLAIPDFRSTERTFQLITQVAGRAGRGDKPGKVAVQTFLPDDPTIQAALAHDFESFAIRELAQRKEVGYPPYTRMARIIIREQEENKLQELSDQIAGHLTDALNEVEHAERVAMKGPMPCAVNRIAGYFRNQIVLISPDVLALQRVLARMRKKGNLARTDRVAVDVDPVNLL